MSALDKTYSMRAEDAKSVVTKALWGPIGLLRLDAKTKNSLW